MSKRLCVASLAALCCTAQSSSVHADTYSNGPIVTHPGGGFGASHASALQSSLGVTIIGVVSDVFAGSRLADGVFVPPGQTWAVSGLNFPAYVSGSGTGAPPIVGVNIRVWDGLPGSGGQVVWGDATQNMLIGAAFANIYRVPEDDLKSAARPIFNYFCVTPGLTLDGGATGTTYWFDWQCESSTPSVPRLVPVTIAGSPGKPSGDALWFSPETKTWNLISDPPGVAKLDAAFSIDYVVGGGGSCQPDCDANRLLDIDDFICFQTYFALQDPYADCDATGDLTIDDFICFQTLFAIGC